MSISKSPKYTNSKTRCPERVLPLGRRSQDLRIESPQGIEVTINMGIGTHKKWEFNGDPMGLDGD